MELYDAIHTGGRLDQGIIVARSEGGEEAMGYPLFSELVAAEGTELEVPSDLSPDDRARSCSRAAPPPTPRASS